MQKYYVLVFEGEKALLVGKDGFASEAEAVDYAQGCHQAYRPVVVTPLKDYEAGTYVFIQLARKVIAEIAYLDYHLQIRVNDRGTIELSATYMDADIYTGKPQLQTTRRWLLTPAMTPSEVVSTAFKCCLTSSEHRAREAFKYKGARIFGPHFDVEDLARLCKDGREDAGGRNPTNQPTF